MRMSLIKGETKVPRLGSLGFLYWPVGPSTKFSKHHRFRAMHSTNTSEWASRRLFTAKEHSTLRNYRFESLVHSFLSSCG